MTSIVSAAVYPLDFRPVTTEYSASLNKLVMISGNPNRLHVYNAVNGTDGLVALSSAPLSVGISPDGLKAVVGHSKLISLVNLQSGVVEKTFPVSIDVNNVVLTSTDAYINTGRAVSLNTGIEREVSSFETPDRGRLRPGTNKIYVASMFSGILYLDLDNPQLSIQMVSANFHTRSCPDLFFSTDGTKLFACGLALTVLPDKLQYLTRMAEPEDASLLSLSQSVAAGSVLTIFKATATVTDADTNIRIFTGDYLNVIGKIRLPSFSVGTGTYPGRGRFVTFSNDSQRVYAVVQADPLSGLNNDFVILSATYPATSGGCAVSLSPGSAVAKSGSSAGSISVTAAEGCIWKASSSDPWIHLPSEFGIGSATLAYTVSPNAANARSGNIQIDGTAFRVDQVADPSVNPLPLPARPIASHFSKILDSLVLISTNPNRLILFNPSTRITRSVPLPKLPFRLALSVDGTKAAVTMDGFVAVINLQTASVTSVLGTNMASSIPVVPNNGFIHVFPVNYGGFNYGAGGQSIDLTSGARTAFEVNFNNYEAQLHPSNRFVYATAGKYSVGSGPLVPTPGSYRNLFEFLNFPRQIWFTEDGGRIITPYAVLRASEIPTQDLEFIGNFSGSSLELSFAAHSAAQQSIAVAFLSNTDQVSALTNEVRIHHDQDLSLRQTVPGPKLFLEGAAVSSLVTGLHWNADASKLYSLISHIPLGLNPQPLADSLVFTITPSATGVTCSYAVSGAPVSPLTSTSSGTLSVTTVPGCVWSAMSSSSWLRITSGSPTVGSGGATYILEANPALTARTALLTVGDKQFTVSQAGLPLASTVPELSSLLPLTGAGFTGTFNAVFTHNGGASQHYLGYILFLPTPNIVWFTAKGSCLIEYNRISKGVRLINDGGDNWLGPIEGVPIGPSAGQLSNIHCTVNVAGMTASVSSDVMLVSVPVTFKNTLSLVMGTFLQAQDVNGKWTDMRQFGNWVLPEVAPKAGPSVVALNPAHVNNNALYSVVVSHTNGFASLGAVHLRFGATIISPDFCHVIYFPLTNRIELVNDSGSSMVNQTGLTPGASASLANSRCSVAGPGSAGVRTAQGMTIILPMNFSRINFPGTRNVYVNAFDISGGLTHWVKAGSLLVQ